MVKISVIIPVYKVEKTLKRCVDSVLCQTVTDYEIILVDDGSPDRCGEICDAYRSENDCVTVIHKENGGLSDARNAGLAAARGEAVMFLDSDDYLSPDCLETLCCHDADMVIGSIVYAFESKENQYQPPREDETITRRELGEKLPALLEERRLNYVHAKLYRKSIIDENRLCFEDDMLTSAEDTVFNFTFLKYCDSIFVSSKPVHFYVQNTDGLAKRFYPDRYQRYRRLNDYIRSSCEEMGVYTAEAEACVNERMCRSAIWTMYGILEEPALSRSEKIRLLDEISEDMRRRNYPLNQDTRDRKNLDYLIRRGGEKMLARYSRGEFFEKVRYRLGIH